MSGSLRQGEILSGLVQLELNINSLRLGKIDADEIIHPFSIILSQDCDCEQDYKSRSQNSADDKLIPTILFCEVITAEQLRGNTLNSKEWVRVRQNKNERYQFLEAVSVENDFEKQGLPELGIDFKRFFTIPTEEVYYRIEITEAKRRCRLVSPYLEHLSSRFSYFLHRVALPSDHSSK